MADHYYSHSVTFAQALAFARNSSYLVSPREHPAVVLWMGQPSTPPSHSATLFSFMLRPIVGSLLIGMLHVAGRTHRVVVGDGCLERVSSRLAAGDVLLYIGINYLGAFSRMGLSETRSCQNMPHLASASRRGAYVVLYSTDSRCQLNSQAVTAGLAKEVWDYSHETAKHCARELEAAGRRPLPITRHVTIHKQGSNPRASHTLLLPA